MKSLGVEILTEFENDEPLNDDEARKLIRDYELQTEIIKNQTEMLTMFLRGMRQ
jgi:hypothetical protein